MWPRQSSYFRASAIVAFGTTFNVFFYAAVWAENITKRRIIVIHIKFTLFKHFYRSLVFFIDINYLMISEISEKDDYVSNSIGIGTALFELYLALQSIVRYLF